MTLARGLARPRWPERMSEESQVSAARPSPSCREWEDPFPDIQSPPVRSQLRPFIQVGCHGYPHQVIRRNRSGQR